MVDPKRVRRLLRKMGVMAIYPKRNLSKLGLAKYIDPYKLRRLIRTIARVNQGLCQGCGICVAFCRSKSIDIHYTSGNFHARRRWIAFRSVLDLMGVDVQRIQYSWVSAAEGSKWADLVNNTVADIRALGPYTEYQKVADYLGKEAQID